jgi:glycosyltransferase involved in cell wall biosynthesis
MPDHQRPLSILHTESSLGWGGQEIRILTEARGFLDRGHKVTLLTPRSAPIFEAAGRQGIPVVDVDISKKRIANLLALRKWLKHNSTGVDVINTHSSTDAWLVALAGVSGPQLPPTVRTRHVSTPIHDNAPTRWLYRSATRHIVTTGEALRNQLHRDNGFGLDHMTSVRTGIDLARFVPLDKAAMRAKLGIAQRPTLGILATLRDWKGHHQLFDAMRLLNARFPEWQLLVIGGGPAWPELQQRIADEAMTNTIHMVGNQDNVPEWLSTLDIFVLPSYGSEGVPQGIMQAMACGLPVVSTPVGAICEAVQDGTTGIITPAKDSKRLAESLALLMANAELRTRYGTAGLAYAREHFGVGAMIDRMDAVFRAALGAA